MRAPPSSDPPVGERGGKCFSNQTCFQPLAYVANCTQAAPVAPPIDAMVVAPVGDAAPIVVDASADAAVERPVRDAAVRQEPRPDAAPDSTADLLALYSAVGRELSTLGRTAPPALMSRYRLIRIADGFSTPEKQAETRAVLEKLRDEIRAVKP